MSTTWREAGQPSVRFPLVIDAVPIVADDAARDALFPTPTTDQRVQNLDTGQVERWSGSAWADDWPFVLNGDLLVGRATVPTPFVGAPAGLYRQGEIVAMGDGFGALYSLIYDDTISPAVSLLRARGTEASPAAVQAEDGIGRVLFGGLQSNLAFGTTAAEIIGRAKENFTPSAHGSALEFWTVPIGSTTRTLVGQFTSGGVFVTDAIGENTSAAGVTIDSALVKDGRIGLVGIGPATCSVYMNDGTGLTGLYMLENGADDESVGLAPQGFAAIECRDAAVGGGETAIGFYGASPVQQQTGVAVTAGAIHAALVALGLITA